MYRIKECVDEFEYKFKDSETGKIKKFKITEKRIVTFNPKLAKKQIYEINKEVEKAKLLKASQAKRSEYGDSAKYVIFTTTDKKGNDTNGKIKVTMNEGLYPVLICTFSSFSYSPGRNRLLVCIFANNFCNFYSSILPQKIMYYSAIP